MMLRAQYPLKQNSSPQLTHDLSPASSPHQLSTVGRQLRTPHAPYPRAAPPGGFFADVVKNVSVPNLELKKLIYMYLVRHAGEQPDLALLSVNSFQRDLSDQNPLIRALALRVMSSIRLPIIQPIVLMAVQKCAKVGWAHLRPHTPPPQPAKKKPLLRFTPPLASRRTARRTCARRSRTRYRTWCRVSPINPWRARRTTARPTQQQQQHLEVLPREARHRRGRCRPKCSSCC